MKFMNLILLVILLLSEYAECKVKFYTYEDKSFTEFEKGIVDIAITRYICFNVSIDLATGMLKFKYKDNPESSIKILDVATEGHLSDAEVFIAKPIWDDDFKNINGYYFILYLSEQSKPDSDGRGSCGGGIENEIVVLITDKTGKITSETRYLVSSCLEHIGRLFIRDSAPENNIYVIFGDNGELKLLQIDYLYPENKIIEIKGKIE